MNGWVYDYNPGRFMSVDPLIQSPGNSQSINPYSYIMNNPLAGTDPTGYCGTAIKGKHQPFCATFGENDLPAGKQASMMGDQVVANAMHETYSNLNGAQQQNTSINSEKSITDMLSQSEVAKKSEVGDTGTSSGGASVELLIGGPYTKANGDKVTYGHVALRVTGENEDGTYDYVYDFGRYGKTWGIGGSEGEGTLRLWTSFDDYIKGENATGRITTGYAFSLSSEQAGKINTHFSKLTSGLIPTKVRGNMQQFRIASNYHAANCNFTTVAMDGLKAGNPKLHNILNQNKFDQGRGLSWSNRQAYDFSKTGDGVRMPLDLQEAARQYGKATAVNTYKW
ncbi:hypothetical protein N477_00810 [Pseudoalteromonas luteoviolacea H33-S]|nr:hypothetical protein N477_00810 [Pseudoalteromonas luteoviolacea H33-S]